MIRKSLGSAFLLALFFLGQSHCVAHSGNAFVAEPVHEEITVDGDLSDWPETAEYDLSVPYLFDGTPDTPDYTGRFRVACDHERGLLYVGVQIIDDVVTLESPVENWRARDACEIFLTLEHSAEAQVPLQFIYRKTPVVAEADEPNEELQDAFDVARRQTDDGLIYEWKISLDELPSGDGRAEQPAVFGFDVGYIDVDDPADVAVFSSSPGRAKHLTSRTLGDLLLVNSSEVRVVAGNVERAAAFGDESGEVAQQEFPPVVIESSTYPHFYMQVPCNDEGGYEIQLPPGTYTASLLETLPVPVAEKETITFEVISEQKNTTIPQLSLRPLRQPNLDVESETTRAEDAPSQ